MPHHTQEPSTRSTNVVRPNPPTASEISLDDLATVTGGADDDRLLAHELTHVVQQASGR